jgi:hypothetical protein
MKQLLIIVFLFLAVTVGTTVYFLLSGEPTREDIALRVNDHEFSSDEVNSYLSGRFTEAGSGDQHHGDRDLMLTAFAEERVLIQEAQRLQIDQQADFRDKIQRYYEYSLISALRNRQEELFRAEIEADTATLERGIDRFIDRYGRPVTFRQSTEAEPATLLFDLVPNSYKPVLADLEPGQSRPVILTGNTISEVTLLEVGDKTSPSVPAPDRDKIRQLLLDYHTGVRLSMWIKNLLDNASITYGKEH